jgi:hypothetical protein
VRADQERSPTCSVTNALSRVSTHTEAEVSSTYRMSGPRTKGEVVTVPFYLTRPDGSPRNCWNDAWFLQGTFEVPKWRP